MFKQLPGYQARAARHLDRDERILAGVKGQYTTMLLGERIRRTATLLATDRRVFVFARYFLGGHETESLPYRNVSSIESGVSFLGPFVRLFTVGNSIEVKWISKGDAKAFVGIVRERIDAAAQNATPSQDASVSAEIERLAALHKRGVITEREFDKAKARLLP